MAVIAVVVVLRSWLRLDVWKNPMRLKVCMVQGVSLGAILPKGAQPAAHGRGSFCSCPQPNNTYNNVLVAACQELHLPSNQARSTAQSMLILMRTYCLATGKHVADTEAEVRAKPAPEAQPTTLLPVHEHEVTLPPTSADTLQFWWTTWYEGLLGYKPLKDYFSNTRRH